MGKTTLLKTLAGILPATAGRVRLAGDDITRLASHERHAPGLGYVPQGREIFPGSRSWTTCASPRPPGQDGTRSSGCWRSSRA